MANQRKKNGEDYSRAFMNQIYRTIHTFFEWVVDEGILSKNPLDRVRKPGYPKKKSPRLKEEELIRLFQAVKAHTQHPVRNLAIIRLMLDAGLRRGELCNLKLSRLDQERRCVRAFGKDKEDRDVPILEETLQAIRDWLGVRPEVDHDYIFTTREGNPMTGNALGLLLYRLKDKTGIPDLCCQLLRHTFANCYIKNGGSLRRLQKALGHSDVTTTAKIYLDPEFSEIQEEHKRVSPLANLDL
jgi:site-specific recombinase XerD